MQIQDTAIVVTGASSGIGRATALTLARRGARLALAARRSEPLQDAARTCEAAGGQAFAVPTDVTDAAAVEALASAAEERLGRIDAWINNAGVYLTGTFEQTPEDAFRRVIDVDLFGVVNGARSALPRFRRQGHGVLVNVSSMAGAIGAPYLTAYAAAKWAVRGFTESLREELVDQPRVHACAVLPASIDTPLFQHAANYTGRSLKALAPVYPPEKVAEAIAALLERPRRQTIVGGAARASILQHRLAPLISERFLRAQVDRTHFGPGAEISTAGNLFEPIAEGTGTHGGWRAPGGLRGRFGRAPAAAAERARVAARHPSER